jgi:hypothetical protein
MKNHFFAEGDNVIVHSLGNMHIGKEYQAVVRGVSVDYGINPATIYILEVVDKIDPDYPYSHYTMPEACLRRDHKVVTV